jgi:transposase
VNGTMTWVGLDVDARSTQAVALEVLSGELRRQRLPGESARVVAWLRALPQPVRACYEAGPTGFVLARAARSAGIAVEVIAPSKIARPAGERLKTDRRDAELLLRLLMAGQLRAVRVPSEAEESARELVRLREQLRQDLLRARHRVTKLLLRHGRVWERPGHTWNRDHRAWIGAQQFDEPDTGVVLAELVATVDGLLARRAGLDDQLARVSQRPELWPTVARLRCFRGVDTLTALALQLDVIDWHRFRPAPLASWLGLVPSIQQSGQTVTRGPITKTGSQHARRLLVEAAWHYQRPPRIGATLANRQLGQPAEVLAIANRAQQRLYRTHRRLRARGRHPNIATIAAARELTGFLWAAATL